MESKGFIRDCVIALILDIILSDINRNSIFSEEIHYNIYGIAFTILLFVVLFPIFLLLIISLEKFFRGDYSRNTKWKILTSINILIFVEVFVSLLFSSDFNPFFKTLCMILGILCALNFIPIAYIGMKYNI